MIALATFDVRPEPRKRRFFRVMVWPTLRDLRKYVNSPITAGAHAATLTHTKPLVGNKYLSVEILFAERHLTHDLITHECLHAVLGWAHLLGIDVSASVAAGLEGNFTNPDEERVCYAIGRTHQRIMAQLKSEGFTIR